MWGGGAVLGTEPRLVDFLGMCSIIGVNPNSNIFAQTLFKVVSWGVWGCYLYLKGWIENSRLPSIAWVASIQSVLA